MKKLLIAVTLVVLVALGWLIKTRSAHEVNKDPSAVGEIGSIIASYKGVPVYQNGQVVAKSHGRHYAWTGYYYGQKWQCVEYVKRFYYDALGHRMPDVWGHAKDFFDFDVPHRGMNESRDLLQFYNGENEKPQPNDLLVYAQGSYGHVSIIQEVGRDSITVIQQNIYGAPTDKIPLCYEDGKWTIGEKGYPSGWLRKLATSP